GKILGESIPANHRGATGDHPAGEGVGVIVHRATEDEGKERGRIAAELEESRDTTAVFSTKRGFRDISHQLGEEPGCLSKEYCIGCDALDGMLPPVPQAALAELDVLLQIQLLKPRKIRVGLVQLIHYAHVPVSQLLAAELERDYVGTE